MNILNGAISTKNVTSEESTSVGSILNQTEFFNSDDVYNFSRKIFYACSSCNGPLVPTSNCTFCKKTSLRRCAKCDKVRYMHTHESCKILVEFGMKIAQKYAK